MKFKPYVFVDFFDTVVFRNMHPDMTKKVWARELSILFNYSISSNIILQSRLNSELELSRQNVNGVFTYQELCENIFNRLQSIVGFTLDFDRTDFYINSLKTEERIELSTQIFNKKFIAKLRAYRQQKKKIYIVSDFYLGKGSYLKFLKSLNAEDLFDDIFVSCDWFACKANGSLYQKVIQELNIEPSQVLMIGDNKKNDYKVAQQEGLNAKYISNKKQKKKYKKLLKNNDTCTKLKGIFNMGDKVSNYAFSLYLFCDRLYKICLNKNIKKLFFLAREGQFLKRCFDNYLSKRNGHIQTLYLYVSRNSTFGASLQNLSEEKFTVLFRQYKKMSVKKFLELLNFSEEDIKNLAVENIDVQIDNFATSEVFAQLKANEFFIDIYNRKRGQQKTNFIKYISDLGYGENEELYLVDVGWKGSMQDNIFHLFNSTIRVHGIYLGLTGIGEMASFNTKQGILFDNVTFSSKTSSDIYMLNMLFYELVLSAGHGKTIGYSNDGHPILKDDEDVLMFQNVVGNLQEKIFEKLKKISAVYSDYAIEDDELKLFELLHYKMFKSFKLKEFNLFFYLFSQHKDSFLELGSHYNRFIFNLKMLVKPYIKGSYYLKHKNGIKK